MYTQVEKPKENKSRAVGNAVAQKSSTGRAGFDFVDNRPETIAQRKLQTKANSYTAQQQQPMQKKENKFLNGPNKVTQRVPRFEGSMDGNPSGDFVNNTWRIEPQLSEAATPAPVKINELAIDQTKHHIIPLQLLRQFISAVNTNNHLDNVNLLFQGATETMMANSPMEGEGEQQVRMQGALTQDDLTAEINKSPDDQRNGEAFSAVISAFAWMPGNIFIGPINNQRIDDPGENFETHAVEPAGNDLFAALQLAHTHINNYIGNNSAETLALAVEQLLIVSAVGPFHPYIPDHWEIDELTANDFTFEGYDDDQGEILNHVGLFARRRHMFKLNNAPDDFQDNPNVQVYIAHYQELIDGRIAELNAPPPEYEAVNPEDEFDLGGLFG